MHLTKSIFEETKPGGSGSGAPSEKHDWGRPGGSGSGAPSEKHDWGRPPSSGKMQQLASLVPIAETISF